MLPEACGVCKIVVLPIMWIGKMNTLVSSRTLMAAEATFEGEAGQVPLVAGAGVRGLMTSSSKEVPLAPCSTARTSASIAKMGKRPAV